MTAHRMNLPARNALFASLPVAVLLALLPGVAPATPSIDWDQAGGPSSIELTSGTWTLKVVVGQSVAGDPLTNGSWRLDTGFLAFPFDTTPPTAQAPVGNGNPYTNAASFTWAAPSDYGGIRSIELRVGTSPGASDVFDGDVTTATLQSVAAPSGTILYARLHVVDTSSNATDSAVGVPIIVDTAGPVTAIVSPTTGTIEQVSPVFLVDYTATDTLSGVAGVELRYSRNGAAAVYYPGGPFTASPIPFDTSQTGGDGVYEIRTVGTDALGNVESPPTGFVTLSFTLQPPTEVRDWAILGGR